MKLIKFIGLYAASLSTLVAWGAMFIYRFIDSKKYIKLKVDTKIALTMILVCAVTVFSYYLKNMAFCGVVALGVTIYAFLINKNSLSSILKLMKSKILKK